MVISGEYSSSLSRSWRYRVVDVRLCVRGDSVHMECVRDALSEQPMRRLQFISPLPQPPSPVPFQPTQLSFTQEPLFPSPSLPLQSTPTSTAQPLSIPETPLSPTLTSQSSIIIISDSDETRSILPNPDVVVISDSDETHSIPDTDETQPLLSLQSSSTPLRPLPLHTSTPLTRSSRRPVRNLFPPPDGSYC